MDSSDQRSSIRVQAVAPSESRRLTTTYHADIGILVAERSELCAAPFGINIDAMLILDMDVDKHLVTIEVISHRSGWKVKPVLMRLWDREAQPKDLEVLDLDQATREIDEPIEISTSEDRSVVHVELHSSDTPSRQVSLGPDCHALIDRGVLLGFLFRLS